MIISKIKYGLGNQLFQWAHGKSFSLKNDLPYYIIKSHKFSLDKFPNLKYNTLPFELSSIQNLKEFYDNFNFLKIDFDNNFNYYIEGCWQSEDYFSEFKNEIKQELKPTTEVINSFKSYRTTSRLFVDCVSVSLHIRRGDFLKTNGFNPVLPVDYYENAIDLIGDYDYIFVFSDDIEWCKKNLYFKNIIFMEGFEDIEDLWLMSMCKHNIIANSTFSWWAAWLNSYTDKKVIAPETWFGPESQLNTEYIIPKKWIKI
jgi:hypothetical protein